MIKQIPFSPPDMSEAEAKAASEAILSGWITTGPRTKEFERQIAAFCHTRQAVCLNSATAAMETALRLIGVGADDEVVVPAYTYSATASAVLHVGARLVMVDSQRDDVQMSLDRLAAAITERTKVIVPVDLGGIVCPYDELRAVVESKRSLFRPSNALQRRMGRIIIAADCAHAFGAERDGKRTGEIADMSSFSFHAVKNLTTAEGGALTWHLPFGGEPAELDATSLVPPIEGETWDEHLYRLAQLYSLHGQNKDALAKTKLGAWEYDIIGPWYKCNMTDIMAAIGLAQLQRYPDMLRRRAAIVARYDEAFRTLPARPLHHATGSSYHLYIVRLTGRTREETNRVITRMAEMGVACNVHYKPLPMMTAYRALGFRIEDYPNAYHLFENTLTLPLHTRLTDDDVAYIIDCFKTAVGEL